MRRAEEDYSRNPMTIRAHGENLTSGSCTVTPPYTRGDVPCAGGGPDQHPLKPGKWQEKVGLAFVLDHWAQIIQGRGRGLSLSL